MKAKPGAKAKPRDMGKADAFPIAGIGASAGGLDALERLLKQLPSNIGMAFVVVQHLDPKHESRLTDILSRVTSMPVSEVRDGVRIERDRVYIIPPNASMFVRDHTLRLEPRKDPKALPVDSFLRSLAETQRHKAVGVILSGTASDGAAGVRAIKAAGGITFAQDSESARYFGMPQASIATGAVDFVLPPEDIAKALVRIGRHPYVKLPALEEAEQGSPKTEVAFESLLRLLTRHFGVDFSAYKRSTVSRRIKRRQALRGMNSLAEYVRLCRENPEELRGLYGDMFIGVTSFFREPESFAALKKQVFPRLLRERRDDAPIRVWVPGCSTGEEVYSLAVVLLECLKGRGGNVPIQIFGTDVNEEAVKTARQGRYPQDIAPDVGAQRLRRFFTKTDTGYVVGKSVRDLCVFARHDVLRDPPFSHLDLISCRNVLIYVDATQQRRLVPLFHYALRPGGLLLLGSAETIGAFGDLFTLVDRKNKLHVKKAALARQRLDVVATALVREPVRGSALEAGPAPSDFDRQKDAADLLILNEYAPAAVLVNEDGEILHFRGHTGPYLEPAPGVASLNVLKMARDGLLLGLRRALQSARKKAGSAVVEGLRVEYAGHDKLVDVHVLPVKTPGSRVRSFLVLFKDLTPKGAPPPRVQGRRTAAEVEHGERLAGLKHELNSTKAYLQSVIENHEAANEELRSLNEELLSTNEELQSTTEELETSNEELQSANEELITVNEELHHRNAELGHAHNDILNLLASMQLSVIIVDRELRIRRMTPRAQNELNLRPSDVGRPIMDLRLSFEVPDLARVLAAVVETGKPMVQELQDRNGRWYSLEIRPYRTAEGNVEGAVVALADVHVLKVAETSFRTLVDAAPGAMVVTDTAGRITAVNAETERLFGYAREELLEQPVELLLPAQLGKRHRAHRARYVEQPRPRPMGAGQQLVGRRKDGSEFPLEVSLGPIETIQGLRVAASIRDLSTWQRKTDESRLAAALEERHRLAREVHDSFSQGLAAIVLQLEGAEDVLGPDAGEARRHVVKARELARGALEDARRALLALRPQLLEGGDLPGALEHLAAEFRSVTTAGIEIAVSGAPRDLSQEAEEHLLRIAQEALNNAVKHARAGRIVARLDYTADSVALSIEDDGCGFDTIAHGTGLGLATMRERAERIGARLSVRSAPGRGTRLDAVLDAAAGALAGAGAS